jgi:hypothetical protein
LTRAIRSGAFRRSLRRNVDVAFTERILERWSAPMVPDGGMTVDSE